MEGLIDQVNESTLQSQQSPHYQCLVDGTFARDFEKRIAAKEAEGGADAARSYSLLPFHHVPPPGVQSQIDFRARELRDRKIPPEVCELHLLLVGLTPENSSLVNRVHDISQNWINRNSGGFEGHGREQSVPGDRDSAKDSACSTSYFPSPLRPRLDVTGAPAGVSADGSSLADDDTNGVDEQETGDEDDLAEVDEDDEDDLDPEDEEDRRDIELDEEILPQTPPEWVRQVCQISERQQQWDAYEIFGPLPRPDYLRNYHDTRPSLSPLETQQTARNSCPHPSSSPKSRRSSVPRRPGLPHPNASFPPDLSVGEPSASKVPPTKALTIVPAEGSGASLVTKRYHLRPGRTPSTAIPVVPPEPSAHVKGNGKHYLRRPARRRAKPNGSRPVKGLTRKDEPLVGTRVTQPHWLPVCERIRLSYLPHPDVPLRIVSHGKSGRQFDPFEVSGSNIYAILDPSIHNKLAEWSQAWMAGIPFDLDDDRLLNEFRDRKAGIASLYTSMSKARAALDVARILRRHVVRAKKYPAYLDFLHFCAVRVYTYWEKDPIKARDLLDEWGHWGKEKGDVYLCLAGICARLPKETWGNRQAHLVVTCLSEPFGVEKLKERFAAGARPFVFSQFLKFLREREMPPLLKAAAPGPVTPESRLGTMLDTIQELFKNVADISPDQIVEALAFVSPKEREAAVAGAQDNPPTQLGQDERGAKRPVQGDGADTPAKRRKNLNIDSGFFELSGQAANSDMTEGLMNADVEKLATYMEEIGKAVDSRITTKAGVRSLCGPNAIRCLTAHTSFCEDLVHGLCSMPTTVNAVLLATVPYSALEKSNWAGETDWVGDIVRGDHDWILPIRDGDSWQAARLSWSGRRILCYNPICSAETASSSLRILKVRKTLKEWFRTIEGGSGSGGGSGGGSGSGSGGGSEDVAKSHTIFTSLQKGPTVDAADSKESGPWVVRMLLSWQLGEKVMLRQRITPIEVRRQLLELATKSIRGWPTTVRP